ncbi:MAG TPA: serine--tRNA ligase [Bacilli bacterium]|nr:serine--tRNA ligase [Bacilli bacterium]
MIDINLIREHPEKVREALKKKGWDFDARYFLALDVERRKIRTEVEATKAQIRKLSEEVPKIKKAGGDVAVIFKEVKALKDENSVKEAKLQKLDAEVMAILVDLPNMPDQDLLPGGKENNERVYVFGTIPKFTFKPKDHVELAESLELIDYKRAAKISGAGTWIYKGVGAELEWALLNYFMQTHLKANYEMILPPHILNEESGFTAGQFPKFADDVFWLEGVEPRKFLLPTSETALVNYHRNEILTEKELPKKYFSYTPCYRKEAGSYGTEERGMIRGYQFNKVEIFQFASDKNSEEIFNEMVDHVKALVEALGLHFQVSKLAAGDCSHSMARTYDVEVYIPSMDTYKEVSSVSNARSYQARRGMVRYRETESGQIRYIHTLNGSGLATSRLIPAILEQFQQENGSVIIPEVLRPYLGGRKVLEIKG